MYDQIYLIDDEEIVNVINTINFRKLGLEDKLKTFTNPELALDDLRFRKDATLKTLILLDINMPEMTGIEFLEFMKLENFPLTNEVWIVTSSEIEAEAATNSDGNSKYSEYVKHIISKPLNIEVVKEKLGLGVIN